MNLFEKDGHKLLLGDALILLDTQIEDESIDLVFVDPPVYHIGASLKDLGNKVFAFSKISIDCKDILKKL